MKFYTFPPSPNCRKVAAVIDHLGLEGVEEVFVDLTRGESRTPGFLAVNPNGAIPALVDGEFRLWESNAIMQYLCSKRPENPLYPSDPRGQADVNRWLFWLNNHFGIACGKLTYEHLVKPMMGIGEPDPRSVEQGLEGFHRYAAVLDSHLAGRRFLVGDQPTIADFAVASMLTYAGPARIPVEPYGNLREWLARMDEVPAWKRSEPAVARP